MKKRHQILSCGILMLISMASLHAGENCVNCGPKEPVGLPSNGKELSVLEKIANKVQSSSDQAAQDDYMSKYCMKFKQIAQQGVGLMIKEMEATPYPVDEYFNSASCQPDGYSNAIKSPIIHIIADDPNAKEESLKNVWAYYSKKRKKPEIFTEALNSKNTKGETLLDYIETLQVKGITSHPDQQEPIRNIIKFVCEHGGKYSAYKNKKCPVDI